MGQYKETKINRILQHLPKSAVATTKWLSTFGVGSDLLNKYKKTHWFTKIGHGAVIRTGDKPLWAGAVYALQEQLKLPIHVGGKSAMGYQGHAHYIPLGKGRITLYCPYKTMIPKWFTKYDWQTEIKVVSTNLFPADCKAGRKIMEVEGFSLQIAALELAMIETVSGVPANQSFDEARKLMAGLNTLHPATVQILLEKCNSVKAKRLFLLLAERENHPWMHRIKPDKIDLGSGNRVLVKGGVLDKKYHVTVPRNWQKEDEYQ